MWNSKSKHDLIIEVWEKLDCESVGRIEIEAIETVVDENYGLSPAESPMRIARLLADEGAQLRHSEILELDVERRTASADLPDRSRPLDVSNLSAAYESIGLLETLRSRFREAGNKDGIRTLRKRAITARDRCLNISTNQNKSERARNDAKE
ncbi:MAG: hypothetical protein OEQ28_14100, partial [Acidobacteriota bacterium]|nr:hypothetical protein [Acidobacteriota bacterium]